MTRPPVCLKIVLLYVADNHEPALQAKTPSPHLQLPARVKMPAGAWFVQEAGQGKAWRDGRESSFWGVFNVGLLQIYIQSDESYLLRRWIKAFPVLDKLRNKS